MSNPISISPQNEPDNLQLLNNTRYKRKRHTLLSLSLLQTQTQPNKHCKTHTLLSLSLYLYPSPSPKPKCQSDLIDYLSWDIGTNQVSETKTIPLERGVVILKILGLILLCISIWLLSLNLWSAIFCIFREKLRNQAHSVISQTLLPVSFLILFYKFSC